MVKFAWFFGRVAVIVEYFEQIGPDEIEGGARVEIRRVAKELIAGAPAAVSGFRVLPVSDGIWRADLFHLLNRPGDNPIYHYHPNFHDGDVGERQFDPGLTGDHLAWAFDRVADLKPAPGARRSRVLRPRATATRTPAPDARGRTGGPGRTRRGPGLTAP